MFELDPMGKLVKLWNHDIFFFFFEFEAVFYFSEDPNVIKSGINCDSRPSGTERSIQM